MQPLDGMEIEEDKSVAFPANQPSVCPPLPPSPPCAARPHQLLPLRLLTDLCLAPVNRKEKKKSLHLLADHHLGLHRLLLIGSLLDGVSPISFFFTERTVPYLSRTCCRDRLEPKERQENGRPTHWLHLPLCRFVLRVLQILFSFQLSYYYAEWCQRKWKLSEVL